VNVVTQNLSAPVRLSRPPTTFGARLSGFGAAQPDGLLSGAELGARVGRTADWIEARTGIRELRTLSPDARIIDLALRASTDALASAGIDPATIDLVIGATCSIRTGSPQLSTQVSRVLAPDAATMDINAACAGFCYSLATADSLIRQASARRVLVVAAEHMTGLVDPTDLGTSIIFGDGAGAAVLDAAPDDGFYLGPVAWGSDGASAHLITIPDGEQFMTMAGQQVFRWATTEMQHVALEACRLAGVTPADIDVFVPHQANARIVDALTTQIGLEHATVSRDICTSGNTSAASIPIAINRLINDGHVHSGQIALVLGFGAGLAYAAQVVRLPQ
jgi:3-oxoacyl-[acyl-carrier-protein] synthase-3